MISRIRCIATNTFREAVRDRVLYSLIVFALLLISASLVFGQISIGIQRIVLVNLGLAAISVLGAAIAIFIGTGLVSKEIEKRTLYVVLSRPVHRWEFIAGKFAGLVATLVVNASFMAAGFFLALFVLERRFTANDASLLVGIYFILLQFVIVTAISMLFSSFSTPLFSMIFASTLFVAGTFSNDLRLFAAAAHGFTGIMATIGAYVVPNISALNVISVVAHGQSVPSALVFFNTLYALFYTMLVLAGAVLVFDRRSLK